MVQLLCSPATQVVLPVSKNGGLQGGGLLTLAAGAHPVTTPTRTRSDYHLSSSVASQVACLQGSSL